jgi:hypothetical protein
MIGENATYEDRVVRLDHATFHKCRFVRCTFVYAGLGSYALEECQLVDCRWSFEGPAANLLQLFRTLYASEGGRAIVDSVFDALRTGAVPTDIAPPPGTIRH